MENLQVQLNFDPVQHKYSDERGVVYTSATTLIGKYKPKFDKRYWSMYVALRDAGFKLIPFPEKQVIKVNGKFRTIDSLYKNPINSHEVQLVVRKWQHLTDVACERGNEVHDYLEDSINESKGDDGSSNDKITPQLASQLAGVGLDVIIRTQHDLDKTTIGERFPEVYTRLLNYIKMGCTIFAEKKVYTTRYEIAGMIDVLIVKGKWFAILDWKTNKDIMMFRSGYFKKERINGQYVKTDTFIEKKDYLFKPIGHVENCKGMIYSLQLSLYAYIMELWGYKLIDKGLEIFHFRPNLRPKLIKIKYLKKEIHDVLEHHRNNRILKKENNNNSLFGIK